ncbi:zinc-dependent alcohol dehydrogenase family protein [Salinibacterium sp. ZJ454]|uniref:zinc-dependent alcohol dehydrogenase family protein n=1 Tax=Salinibacterium sp. ZJ454 TaxID=2708339 RepID=UPI00141F1443|nr:zinc-dependent alcohol dehydrogenase family protein [Salinibacterium sp. ZJ454]
MLATMIYGERDIRVEERPNPTLHLPTDAVVRVVASCVCGSDLWPYRGVNAVHSARPIGHEFVGVIEQLGADVATLRVGDFVIAPFTVSDGTCSACRHGVTSACEHLGSFGARDEHGFPIDGCQGQFVRVPLADGTLVPVPAPVDDALVPSLLTLSDVMSTGHHAAVSAGVGAGSTVVVVGDGAVGLCGVLAAARLGAGRIVAMSRHADRQALAREFGATDIVAERGAEGVAAVRDLLGELADCTLEAVGTEQSMAQALGVTRPGGRLGFVGVPAGGPQLPVRQLFDTNITVGGGMAPARAYIPQLLPDVLSGAINPGRVFDLELPLTDAAEAYAAMDERRAIKVLLRP